MKFIHSICSFFVALTLAVCACLAIPAQLALAQIDVTANSAPPPIPVTDQPPCPGDGYLWTPGYWAYGPRGYLWQAGAWVTPPYAGVHYGVAE